MRLVIQQHLIKHRDSQHHMLHSRLTSQTQTHFHNKGRVWWNAYRKPCPTALQLAISWRNQISKDVLLKYLLQSAHVLREVQSKRFYWFCSSGKAVLALCYHFQHSHCYSNVSCVMWQDTVMCLDWMAGHGLYTQFTRPFPLRGSGSDLRD